MRKRRGIDWTKVDWQTQDVRLAEQLGVTANAVADMRRRLGKPASPNKGKRKSGLITKKWLNLDWTKQDSRLAKELGVSRERVRQMRRKLKRLDPASKYQRVEIEDRLREMSDSLDWKQSDIILAAEIGVIPHTVSVWRQRLGKPKPIDRRTRVAKWGKVNWAKQDAQIAIEMDVTRAAVGQMRRRLGKPRSPFFGVGCPRWKKVQKPAR
jgi:hypothetical protein